MKLSNQITIVSRAVGLPESEMVTSGTVLESFKQLLIWVRETRMPSRIEIGIGRTESEAREVFQKGKPKTEAQESFDDLVSELGLDMFMDDEPESVAVSPEGS